LSSIVIHFPDGDKEFRYSGRDLEVGDIVLHDGERYRILAITPADGRPAKATVEPDSDDLGDLIKSEKGAIELFASAT
jgi:hypothetical protein